MSKYCGKTEVSDEQILNKQGFSVKFLFIIKLNTIDTYTVLHKYINKLILSNVS